MQRETVPGSRWLRTSSAAGESPDQARSAGSKNSKMQAERTRITTDGAEDDRIFLPDHKDNNHAKHTISNVEDDSNHSGQLKGHEGREQAKRCVAQVEAKGKHNNEIRQSHYHEEVSREGQGEQEEQANSKPAEQEQAGESGSKQAQVWTEWIFSTEY